MRFYLAGLRVKERLCVVIGGGRVAARKVRGLLERGARVRVVSPALSEPLAAEVAEGRVEHIARRYLSGDVREAWLAVAATDDAALNARIAEEAEAQRVWTNVVSDGQQGSFIVPAVVRWGRVEVAVTTSGSEPAFAKALRDALARDVAAGQGEFAQLLRQHLADER
ncbi:MAG: bifunctional precorrin-2 dehydrogenase/sirohydrochlorin ferrochelatase [Thermoflavifilum sp.]|nr:bifunctional precorrin-2 dehydrogenase/sirohydrochlorin ferrochelatase [Thermoflavifilum sp.]MCL6515144.1 bifunctional precorrin-2 dehydrogenase/sirohydrochlorin ferrochelatase [Alicyclobacillus sp.]